MNPSLIQYSLFTASVVAGSYVKRKTRELEMGINNPNIRMSKPFSDHFREGDPFTLVGGEVVTANSEEYGKGEMAVLDIRTGPDTVESFGIWGSYIVEQVKSIEPSDVPGRYIVERDVVEGYSKRQVKKLTPYSETSDDDIPF